MVARHFAPLVCKFPKSSRQTIVCRGRYGLSHGLPWNCRSSSRRRNPFGLSRFPAGSVLVVELLAASTCSPAARSPTHPAMRLG